MNDYHLYARDVSEERFASRARLDADKPIKPRKPFVQRLCIFVAVVVGIALALAVAVVVSVLIMYFGQGGFHSEPQPLDVAALMAIYQSAPSP